MNDRTHNQAGNGGGLLGLHLTPEQQTAYIDGDLTTADRERVSAHLTSCPQCAQDLADLQATVTMVSALPSYRAKRSFQLSDAQVKTTGRWWQRLGFRLLPALPALRTATVAAALLLVVASVGDLIWNESGTSNVVRQTSTEDTFGNSTFTTIARTPTKPSEPTQAKTAATSAPEPTSLALTNQMPPTKTATAAPIDTEANAATDSGIDDAAVGRVAETSESEPTGGASGEAQAPAGAAPASNSGADAAEAESTEQTEESAGATGNAAGASAAEPPQSDTDASTGAGDGGADEISMAAAAEETPDADQNTNAVEGFAPAPEASPSPIPPVISSSTPASSPVPASPTAVSPSPTVQPAATSETTPTSTDADVSGWRIAQITIAIALAVLIVSVVVLTRLRRQQAANGNTGTFF